MTFFYDALIVDNTGVHAWDASHWTVLGLFGGAIAALAHGASSWSDAAKTRVRHALAYVVASTVVLWSVLRVATGQFTASVDLPFHLPDEGHVPHVMADVESAAPLPHQGEQGVAVRRRDRHRLRSITARRCLLAPVRR